MAQRSVAVVERPETHRWRGVVEDFIAMKPAEHSYECVLKHTDNLLQKMRRGNSDVDAIVRQGVIPPLVGILDHKDLRDCAKLQHTAVQAVLVIVDRGSHTDQLSDVAAAGGIPPLLRLLKLRLDEVAMDVLELLLALVQRDKIILVSRVPGCVEAFLAATRCEMAVVKQASLSLIETVFAEAMPPAEKIPGFLTGMLPLLGDADAETVSSTCYIFKIVAKQGDIPVIKAIMSMGVLPHVFASLEKRRADQNLLKCTNAMMSCLHTLARKSRDCVKEVLHDRCLDFLLSYLHPYEIDAICIYATIFLTRVLLRFDDDILAEMIERKLVPSVQIMFEQKFLRKLGALPALLPRFLMNSTYLQEYLEPHFLSYLTSLHASKEWRALSELLTIFTAALEETERQGKLADVKQALLKSTTWSVCAISKLVQTGMEGEDVLALCLK